MALYEKGQSGNPEGRPKGSKNKFTLFKEAIMDIWDEEEGKERLKRLIKDDKLFREYMIKMVIPILPKDPLVKVDNSQHYTKVVYEWGNKESNDTVHSSRLPGTESKPSS